MVHFPYEAITILANEGNGRPLTCINALRRGNEHPPACIRTE